MSRQITQTVDDEYEVRFSKDAKRIIFTRNNNLFSWDIANGQTVQITNFTEGNKPEEENLSGQEAWLKNDQLKNFEILKKEYNNEQLQNQNKERTKENHPPEIYTGNHSVIFAMLSPSEEYVYHLLYQDAADPNYTRITDYVTVDGFTKTIQARPKVGGEQSRSRSAYGADGAGVA